MTAELVLHLELDGFEVDHQKDIVKDLSDHHHAGELKGNVGIVADDAFGACANFDGDSKSYISVPSAPSLKITGEVTVEAWVYITKATTAWVRVIGKGTVDSRSYGLWYLTDPTTTFLFQRGKGTPHHDCQAVLKLPATPLNTWYHLTGVVRGNKSSLYVHDLQEKLITQGEKGEAPSGALIDNDSHVTIGHAPSMHAAHSGKIAHARIYKGALSLAEIERDIRSDRLSLDPFRKSHPIDFRLNDGDDQPVLYIVDDSADAVVAIVKLELTNTSSQVINIPALASGTSRDHHHFALRFHPGTLSASTIKKLTELTTANQATVLKEAVDWELACLVGATGPVTLYLSYKGATKLLQPQAQLTLTLHGISADAGNGSRGTQVELLPHQLTYVGGDTPITGNRMRYLHITNHRGQKNIPLHIWLVDGNTVLNDGKSPTDLTLRISNGSAERDIMLNEKSRFAISFDVGEDWALTDKDNADKVKVTHGEIQLPRPGHGQETNDTFREWELTFPKEEILAKRGSTNSKPMEIALKGIITSLSSGHANLYVRYEGISGYQDGQFILTVEKTPLVFDREGNIAIGKSIRKKGPPKVDVSGTLVADKLATGHVGIGADLDIKKDVVSSLTINQKIAHDAHYDYSAAPLSIFMPLEKHNGGSTPVGTADILHLVREGVPSAAYGNKVSLAIGRYEHNGQNSRTQLDIKLTDGHFGDHKAVLSLRSNGCVGIGTTSPAGQLEIAVTGDDVITPPFITPLLLVRGGNREYLKIAPQGEVTMGGPLAVEDNVSIRGSLQFTDMNGKLPPDASVGVSLYRDSLEIVGVRRKGGDRSIKLLASTAVEGTLTVRGQFTVDGGMPIFNPRGFYNKASRETYVKLLLDSPDYLPGCFMIFACEEPNPDACDPVFLMKLSDTVVVSAPIYRTQKATAKYTKDANGAISST